MSSILTWPRTHGARRTRSRIASRQVLRASEEGLAGAGIARRLNLSEGTVRNYLSEAIAKLGVTNRIEAARLARQRGWL